MWVITDHACRECLGRILHNPADSAYRCSNCGTQTLEREDICGCGTKLKTGKDAGFRCARNEHRTSEFPGEIVIETLTS